MSLINEALKKAQRQRAEDRADLAPPMPGGGGHRIRRSAPALSTQTIVLLAGGGISLFVVAVVVTVLWINRPEPARPGPAKSPLAAATENTVTAAPVIVLPVRLKAAESDLSTAPSASKFTPATSAANPIQAAPNPGTVIKSPPAPPAPVAQGPTPAALPAEPAPAAPVDVRVPGRFQESIQTLVDALRVTGIRAAGNASKVMINERVYKLNDIVDRSHDLRLIKIASDGLMFTTPDGVTYEKTF
jgi:hypothetical protein